MIELVKGGSQVGVENPHPMRVAPVERGVDRPDRVVTAAARSKPIRLRFEPCLPLGFQRAECLSLQAPIGDHRNPEPTPFRRTRLRDEHPFDRQRRPRPGTVLDPGGQLGPLLIPQHHLAVDARGHPSCGVLA